MHQEIVGNGAIAHIASLGRAFDGEGVTVDQTGNGEGVGLEQAVVRAAAHITADRQGCLGHSDAAGVEAVGGEGVVAEVIAAEGQAGDGGCLVAGIGAREGGDAADAQGGGISRQHTVEAEAGGGSGGAVVGLGGNAGGSADRERCDVQGAVVEGDGVIARVDQGELKLVSHRAITDVAGLGHAADREIGAVGGHQSAHLIGVGAQLAVVDEALDVTADRERRGAHGHVGRGETAHPCGQGIVGGIGSGEVQTGGGGGLQAGPGTAQGGGAGEADAVARQRAEHTQAQLGCRGAGVGLGKRLCRGRERQRRDAGGHRGVGQQGVVAAVEAGKGQA